jgi:hypothetical protein
MMLTLGVEKLKKTVRLMLVTGGDMDVVYWDCEGQVQVEIYRRIDPFDDWTVFVKNRQGETDYDLTAQARREVSSTA